MFTYFIQIEPQKEWWYIITVPSLPWCISEWDTLEEALENIKDAIQWYIFVLQKNKREIPFELQTYDKISVNVNL